MNARGLQRDPKTHLRAPQRGDARDEDDVVRGQPAGVEPVGPGGGEGVARLRPQVERVAQEERVPPGAVPCLVHHQDRRARVDAVGEEEAVVGRKGVSGGIPGGNPGGNPNAQGSGNGNSSAQ